MRLIGWGIVLALAMPPVCAAGPVAWSVSPAVFVDAAFSTGSIVGPAVELGAEVASGHRVAYGLALGFARTDFRVGPDALHRDFATASLGARLKMWGVRPSVGLTLGAGVVVWDDFSETDPDFRSSAHAEESFVPGVDLRVGMGESWGVTAFAKAQVTGWFYAIIDPSESGIQHRFVLGAGVYFR
jgi:hypothetical protein